MTVREPCSRCVKRMAKAPKGYVAWHEWAERMERRYECHQCPDCGRWTIWKRKERSLLARFDALDQKAGEA